MKKKWGQKIYIEWIDALTKGGWMSIDDATKPDNEVFCKTNAFYIGEDKDFIKVAHTVGKTIKNDSCGILWIPKKWITKLK